MRRASVAGGGQGGVAPPGTAHGTCHAPFGRMSDSARPCGAAGKRSLFFTLPGEATPPCPPPEPRWHAPMEAHIRLRMQRWRAAP
jgi:hypothetical protein